MRFVLIICSVFLLNACEKPLAEPETVDPIYLDLRSDAANAKKLADDKKKEAEELEKTLEKPNIEPLERKHTLQQIFLAKKTIALIEQDVAYFNLRAETRKALDRDMYPAIFKAKGKWPDKDEYDRFMAEKRLRAASRNWNDRVPRPAKAPTASSANAEKKPEKKTE